MWQRKMPREDQTQLYSPILHFITDIIPLISGALHAASAGERGGIHLYLGTSSTPMSSAVFALLQSHGSWSNGSKFGEKARQGHTEAPIKPRFFV